MSDTLELLTIQELVAQLQVSDETIYRFIRSGKLQAVRVGRQWRVHKESLDAFLKKDSTK